MSTCQTCKHYLPFKTMTGGTCDYPMPNLPQCAVEMLKCYDIVSEIDGQDCEVWEERWPALSFFIPIRETET